VCCEYLFDSVRPTAVLPCGHTIHSACLKELQRNRTSTCPICLKSYGNMDKVRTATPAGWIECWLGVSVAACSTPKAYAEKHCASRTYCQRSI
jgi:Ring finger domain